MIKYKERPRCRKVIGRLITEGKTLEEITMGRGDHISYSDGLRSQARKMLQERGRTFCRYLDGV